MPTAEFARAEVEVDTRIGSPLVFREALWDVSQPLLVTPLISGPAVNQLHPNSGPNSR